MNTKQYQKKLKTKKKILNEVSSVVNLSSLRLSYNSLLRFKFLCS